MERVPSVGGLLSNVEPLVPRLFQQAAIPHAALDDASERGGVSPLILGVSPFSKN